MHIHYAASVLRRQLRNKVQIYYCSGGGGVIATSVLYMPQLDYIYCTSLFFMFGGKTVIKSSFLGVPTGVTEFSGIAIRWFLV